MHYSIANWVVDFAHNFFPISLFIIPTSRLIRSVALAFYSEFGNTRHMDRIHQHSFFQLYTYVIHTISVAKPFRLFDISLSSLFYIPPEQQ